jgi:hypothetical protein
MQCERMLQNCVRNLQHKFRNDRRMWTETNGFCSLENDISGRLDPVEQLNALFQKKMSVCRHFTIRMESLRLKEKQLTIPNHEIYPSSWEDAGYYRPDCILETVLAVATVAK